MLARRVQTAFRSEHWSVRLNAEQCSEPTLPRDPGSLLPWNPQNNENSLDFEGSEVGIMEFTRKMKVLGVVAGRRRVPPGLNNRPAGLKYSGKRKVWSAGALPRTLATYATSRPVFLDPPGLVLGPSNEGWQRTGPTYWTKPYCTERVPSRH